MKVQYHHHGVGVTSSSRQPPKSRQDDIATPKVPRGLRVLPQQSSTSSSASSVPGSSSSATTELSRLRQEASRLEQWWKDPRWKHTTRIYSGTFRSVPFREFSLLQDLSLSLSLSRVLSRGRAQFGRTLSLPHKCLLSLLSLLHSSLSPRRFGGQR